MTLSVLGAIKGKVLIKGKVISKMVGEKSRSVHRKKRKRNFSGRRKQKEESEETAPDVDEIAALTPSTSRDKNQLSDSDSKETVGSSRKKMRKRHISITIEENSDFRHIQYLRYIFLWLAFGRCLFNDCFIVRKGF